MKTVFDKYRSLWVPEKVKIFLLFLAAGIIAHLDRIIMGPFAIFKTHDTFDSFWPYQVALAKRIVSFQMPGWFPDYMGGLPFFYMDINWLSPPVIISGFFSGPFGFTLVTLMQFVLAGFGAYLFFEYFFKTDKETSFLGGLIWAFGTFNLTYWRIFDLAAIPLLLYCTDRLFFASDRKMRLWLLLGTIIAATNIYFAKGAPFIAFFQLVFIFIVHAKWDSRRRVLYAFTLVWGFVAAINMPVFISLITSSAVGSRSLVKWIPDSPPSLLQSLRGMIMYPLGIAQENLGFIGTLIFIFGLLRFKRLSVPVKALFAYLIVFLFYCIFIDQAVWYQKIRSHLPLQEFRLSRFLLPSPFIILILTVASFNGYVDFIRSRFSYVLAFTFAALALLTWYNMGNYFPINAIYISTSLLIAFVFLLGMIIIQKKKLARVYCVYLLIVLVVINHLLIIALRRQGEVQPPSFKHFFQSNAYEKYRPQKKFDYRIAFVNWHPSAGLFNGYQVAGGYASQYLKRYADFWEALLPGEKEEFLSYNYKAYLLDKSVIKDEFPPKVIGKPTFRTELLALNNVRYIFSLNEIKEPGRFELSLVEQGGESCPQPVPTGINLKKFVVMRRIERIFKPIPFYVYEVKGVLPRVFTTGGSLVLDDRDALKVYLGRAALSDLRNKVVYNKEDLAASELSLLAKLNWSGGGAGEAKIASYADNRIVIDVKTGRPEQLVFTDNYAKEWTATVRGQKTEILPAYGVFRSVLVPAGASEVVFEYRPAYLVYSLWISGLSFIGFIIAGLFWAMRGEK